MRLRIMEKLILIILTTLLISYPETNAEKKYPAVPLTVDGQVYLAFKYPHPATNVVNDLSLFPLYKQHYDMSSSLIADYDKMAMQQAKGLRREKVRRVLSIIGFSLGGSLTGFGVGYIFHALR